jgi:hypothetical protein
LARGQQQDRPSRPQKKEYRDQTVQDGPLIGSLAGELCPVWLAQGSCQEQPSPELTG